MNRLFKTKTIMMIIALQIILSSLSLAAAFEYQRSPKIGILLAAFGSTYPAAQASFQNIEKKIRAAFPSIPVRWAYTSSTIRKKLAGQGIDTDSVEIALAGMMDEDFTHIAVQSLHTIPGYEFHDLRKNTYAFGTMANGFEKVLVGHPLLSAEEDMSDVTEALLNNIPDSRKEREAVIFIGHGTSHPSNVFYTALMHHLQEQDLNVFIGTVEDSSSIENIKNVLLARGIETAYLMPFMSVAGDHAINDIAGDDDDSWKSILATAGIKCFPILKGTAEYDNIVEIWVRHLKKLVSSFG